MAAVSLRFVEPRTVELDRQEVPTPDEGEVLVESECSLVSRGTELLIYRGEAPADLAADAALDTLDGDLSFPLRYGYAAVGEVAAVGPGVGPEWEGRSVFAFHPHQSHFTLEPADLVPIPDGVDHEVATFLPIAETAVNLVLDGAPRVGERVVVFGAGLVGLLTVSILAEYPLEDLTVVEPLASRRAHASRLGADETIPPDAVGADGREADVVLELSGSPEALDGAIGLAGFDGRVVVGSWYGRKRADLDLGGHFHRDRVAVESSQVSTIAAELRGRWDRERRLAVAWQRLRATPIDELLTHRIPITEAPRAYELLETDPETALGVLFTYE